MNEPSELELRENYIAMTQSTVGLCFAIDDRSHLQNSVLSFEFLSRKMCDKIRSYINLSICFTVLLHEQENYIGLIVAKAVVYVIDE